MSVARWSLSLVAVTFSCAVLAGCDEKPTVHDASDSVFASLVWTREQLKVLVVSRAPGMDALACAPLERTTDDLDGGLFESDGPVRIVDVKCVAAGVGTFRLRLPALERSPAGSFGSASMVDLEGCTPMHWEGGLTDDGGEVGPAAEWLECSSALQTTSDMRLGLYASDIMVQL